MNFDPAGYELVLCYLKKKLAVVFVIGFFSVTKGCYTKINGTVVSFVLALGIDPNRERERNVLFNDALNTLYLRLYGVRHMVKDHSDSEKGNPLPPHRLLLSINSKGSFICTIPQTG